MPNLELEQSASIEELTWDKAKPHILSINQELASVIDKSNPDDSHTIFKVRYPYGSNILKKAKLQIPNNAGMVVPIDDNSIDKHTQDFLGYNLNSNPVGIVTKNTIELFIALDDHTIPLYAPMQPGVVFGVYRALNPGNSHQPAFIWDMTAGARSIFMLPKISSTGKHQKIRKAFDLQIQPPEHLMDHWQVFKAIANHKNFTQPWHCEVLFFSKKWFEHMDDPSWIFFNNYLFRSSWENSEFWRNQVFWQMVLSLIQRTRKLRPSIYTANTVKYLLAMGMGELPGFAPAINEQAAPISGLQQVYTDIYNLDGYTPTIIQPYKFSAGTKESRPVYYSLHFPNAIEFAEKPRRRSNLVTDIDEIRYLLDKYLEEIMKNEFNIERIPLYEVAKSISFDYFHNKAESYYKIRDSIDIPEEDQSFLGTFTNSNNTCFASNGPFVSGCIRVSQKKD